MLFSQLLQKEDKKVAFLLGHIYAWPMISRDKKFILAYSAYRKNKYTGNIESYYKKHKIKLREFLGNKYDVRLNKDIHDKFMDTLENNKMKLNGVSVVIKNDINIVKLYGTIEKWLIDQDENIQRWFLTGFMDGRGSLDFAANYISIDLAHRNNPEIAKRKINKINDLIGFIFNYNPRTLQKESHTKNDQFRLNMRYFAGHYGFFRPSLIDVYNKISNTLTTKDDYIYIDKKEIDYEISTTTSNIDINKFAISIKGLSKLEKLEKAKEYRLENFDFDSEDEILYSSSNVKAEAKKIAGFKCELNDQHETFISQSTNTLYVEAHHLIPFAKRSKFDINIDILENLVALCPNCHRKIHLSKNDDKVELLTKLYNSRADKLNKESIHISIQNLMSYYNIKDKIAR